MDRTLRSTRLKSTRFLSNSGKPFECFCSLLKPGVLEIYGREIVVCECPNNICGCKWRGELNQYLLNHRKRCNFQMVKCHCKEEMYKGNFGRHLTSECVNRLVDLTVTEEYDDLYGQQECPRSRLGCKWHGTCKRYEEVHANQCIYQNVVCYCNKNIKKVSFAKHIMTDCDLRLESHPNYFKPELSAIKTGKDKGVQCDRIRELEEENKKLRDSWVNNYHNLCQLLE